MSKIKLILLSLLVTLLSFTVFTLVRLPYERIVGEALRRLERGGMRISYGELKVNPLNLKATLSRAVLKTNLFDLSASSIEGKLLLRPLIFSFKPALELRLSNGSITLPMMPGSSIPFNDGRALLEGGNSIKISELTIRGKEIIIMGEIEGKRYDLRIRPSGEVEKRLSPFLKLLQRDPQGFYILRSEV